MGSDLADDPDSFHHEIKTALALALNPNSPYAVGTAGYIHAMGGEFERGFTLLDRAITVNPFHPDWFHQAYFIDYFHRQDYDHALLELQNHKPVHDFWVHVMYGTTLAKLGRFDEAKVHIKQLAEQQTRVAHLVRRASDEGLSYIGVLAPVQEGGLHGIGVESLTAQRSCDLV